MQDTRVNQLIAVGAVAGGLYLLYKAVQGLQVAGAAAGSALAKAGGAAANLATTVTSPIAAPIGTAAALLYQGWQWATNANIQDTGSVILPDGTTLPLTGLHVTFNDQYGVGTFPYNSLTYVIATNPDPNGVNYDQNGNYHAISWTQYAAALG